MRCVPRVRAWSMLALLAGLAGLGPADAEPGRAGIVTALHGTATVTRASLPGPRALAFRDPILLADRIATGNESLARILLGGRAVVTVRERSVVTVTETPEVSSVDVASGRIALSVAKDRMRPGERIEVRTPNAVAGIRGTVVIAEVLRIGADVATRFTLLSGVIDVALLDAARRPAGAGVVLNPLQAVDVRAAALSPVRSITLDEGKTLSGGFRLPGKRGAKDGPAWVARDQVDQAAATVGALERANGPDRRPDTRADKGEKADKGDKADKLEKTPLPIAPPTTPIVPPTALQGSPGKDKDNKGPKR